MRAIKKIFGKKMSQHDDRRGSDRAVSLFGNQPSEAGGIHACVPFPTEVLYYKLPETHHLFNFRRR